MKRNLIAALLGIAAIAASGTTYAYWASSVTGSNDVGNGTVTIGSGNVVATTVTVGDVTGAGTLVPVGHAVDAGEAEYVMLSFVVAWDSDGADANGHVGALGLAISGLKIDNSTANASLVTTTFQIGGTVTGATFNGDGSTQILADGADVTVFVKVVLAEPANRTQYLAVAGKDITFVATFTVTPS